MTDDYYRLLTAQDKFPFEQVRRNALPPIVGTGDSWRRPGEILVSANAQDALAGPLQDLGAKPLTPDDQRSWRNQDKRRADDDFNAQLRAASGFELYVTDENADERIDSLIRHGQDQLGRDDSIAANTVLFGEGYYMGGPGSIAAPANPPTELPSSKGPISDQPVALSVLDTGVPVDWNEFDYRLKAVIAAQDVVGPHELDYLNEDGDQFLDHQAGHGLFILGLASRLAPGLRIDPQQVLHPFGDGDEATICAGLGRAQGRVINLSLGGYTADGLEPPALASTIRKLVKEGRIIVAAAGNDQQDPARGGRPFWPAAMPEVIAVGAYDSRVSGSEVLADFTNRGDWINVWAPGVELISDFLSGWPVPAATEPPHWLAKLFPFLFRRKFQGWATWSGTSFAAPLVAAAIAEAVTAKIDTEAQSIAPASLSDDDRTALAGKAVDEFVTGLDPSPWAGVPGRKFTPRVGFTA